jgi:hypothetical protein
MEFIQTSEMGMALLHFVYSTKILSDNESSNIMQLFLQ